MVVVAASPPVEDSRFKISFVAIAMHCFAQLGTLAKELWPCRLCTMDNLYIALSLFRRNEIPACVEVCSDILEKNERDQAAWCLKLQALSAEMYVDDEFEIEEEGLADILMDDNAIAQIARPGTSFKSKDSKLSAAAASHSSAGRPNSGVHSSRLKTMEQMMRARTAQTARPVSVSTGRYVHVGTASMLPQSDGYFVNLTRLNVSKYSGIPQLAKPLFQYIYFHGNDVRQALELGALATQACQYNDWWWKMQLGKCYYRLGMFRDAEGQFKSALKLLDAIDIFLWLGKVYIRLDQPLTALDVYKQGFQKYPREALFAVLISRIYDGLDDSELALKYYKDALHHDATDVEAIASIAVKHFYSDQPEIAVRFYRRLLQMGVCNAELYNNLALCCFYSQQYDMAVMCFEHALMMASNDILADIWYNISHLSVGIGDQNLASQCYKLALVQNNDHAESYNNLGVIEAAGRNFSQAEALFCSSSTIAEYLVEPLYNQALVASQIGDVQTEYCMLRKALSLYPAHLDSKTLIEKIDKCFLSL